MTHNESIQIIFLIHKDSIGILDSFLCINTYYKTSVDANKLVTSCTLHKLADMRQLNYLLCVKVHLSDGRTEGQRDASLRPSVCSFLCRLSEASILWGNEPRCFI